MERGVGRGVSGGAVGGSPTEEFHDGIVRKVEVVGELQVGDGSKRDGAFDVRGICRETKREVAAGGVSDDDRRGGEVPAGGGERGAEIVEGGGPSAAVSRAAVLNV